MNCNLRPNKFGFTLLELLVTFAIIGVLFSFALPSYQSNIDTAEEGAVRNNMNTTEVFQEDFRLRTGGYANDLDNIAEIDTAIGWDPRADDGITYAIPASDGVIPPKSS